MRMLSFWGFIIKYVKCKQEKKKNTILSENILGKFVFHETKKVNNLRFLIIVNHFTAVMGNVVNNLFLGF